MKQLLSCPNRGSCQSASRVPRNPLPLHKLPISCLLWMAWLPVLHPFFRSFVPVLYSPLIKKSTKKHPKKPIENPMTVAAFQPQKTTSWSLDWYQPGWHPATPAFTRFHSFFSARQRPGSRVDYPESPGGDLLTSPNASSRDVFFHVNALDEKYVMICWMIIWKLMCCILFSNTASHVSLRLGASVCLKSKKLQRQLEPFHMLKALLGVRGWFFSWGLQPCSASAILSQLGMFQPDVR